MAIQMRRGSHAAFNSNKMVPGELAVILSGDPEISDGKSVIVAFAPGDTKKFLMREDAAEVIAAAIGDALDMTIESGNDAIDVTANETDDGVTYTVTHKAQFSNGIGGLDPASTSAGSNVSLGTTQIDFGGGFWIPVVSIDRYGHVEALKYRQIQLPSTGIATVERIGMVRPDDVSIKIDANGVIRALRPTVDDALSTTSENAVQNKVVTAALEGKADVDNIPASGIVGVIDAANLPSYVDDVIEAYYYNGAMYSDSEHTTALTPESGKIYVDVDSGDSYRWTGSVYARVATDSVASDTENGLMSSADKTKLDTVEQGANNYALPTMSPSVKGGAKLGSGLKVEDDVLIASCYYTTEQVGEDTVLTLVYDLVNE